MFCHLKEATHFHGSVTGCDSFLHLNRDLDVEKVVGGKNVKSHFKMKKQSVNLLLNRCR